MIWCTVQRELSQFWWPPAPCLLGQIRHGSHSLIPFENQLDWLSIRSCGAETTTSCHRAEISSVCIDFSHLLSILIIIRQADAPWPVRSLNLTAKLKNTCNTSTPELSFQRKAVQEYHSCQAHILQLAENDHYALVTPDPCPCSPLRLLVSMALMSQNKCTISFVTDTEDDSDARDDQPKQCTSLSSNLFPNSLYHQYSQKEMCYHC